MSCILCCHSLCRHLSLVTGNVHLYNIKSQDSRNIKRFESYTNVIREDGNF